MTGKALKVAVVGASLSKDPAAHQRFAVAVHLPVLKALSDLYEVVATCTTRMETATAAAQRFQVPHAFDSVERMLRELPDIDVVCASVRPVEQHKVVMAALRAGKHVYCEHPMGCSVEQAREMADLARRIGVRTVVGHEHHYEPAILHAAELIKQGYLGKPLIFNIVFFNSSNIAPQTRLWTLQADMGGASAWRTGHSLERIISTLGDVTRICADMAVLPLHAQRKDPNQSQHRVQINNVNLLMRVGDGMMGTVQHSLTAWFGTGWDFQVYGTEGMLIMRTRESLSSEERTPSAVKLYGATNMPPRLKVDAAGTSKRTRVAEIAVPEHHAYVKAIGDDRIEFLVAQMWHAFATAIKSGTECAPNFRDELKIHCVWNAAEQSLRDSKWAEVDYSPMGEACLIKTSPPRNTCPRS